MNFSSLAAALSLVAAPPQEAPPAPTEGYILPCDKQITLKECLQAAKEASIELQAPVMAIGESESGKEVYTIVLGDTAEEVDPRDLMITIQPEPTPAPDNNFIFIPAV